MLISSSRRAGARWTACACAGAMLALAGCGGSDPSAPASSQAALIVPAGDNVVLQWEQAHLQAIRTVKLGPPISARGLAMVSTAMYDAWAAYDARANGTRYGDTLRRPASERTDSYKSKAISYAALETLLDIYPSQKSNLEALMVKLGYDPAVRSSDAATPEGIGHLVAQAVLAYRHVDGANQLGDLAPPGASGNPIPYADYTGYLPVNPAMTVAAATPLAAMPHPEAWQPLSYPNPAGATVTPAYIAPHWGKVIGFALTRSDQLRPAPPAAFGSADYVAQVQEVIDLTATLDDRQKSMADYWADGPNSEQPPGHWHLFARLVSGRDRHTLDDDAKMYFALSNAVFDAGIGTWEAKRYYNTSRPITAVRYLFNGKRIRGWGGPGLNDVDMDGAAWIPFQPSTFPVPPFAEYVSGHSAFSAAAAEVLRRYTGADTFSTSVTVPAHSLKAEPASPASDVVLAWHTFSEAADEAGMSRRYGGIHFRAGDEAGRQLGRSAGAQAYLKAASFWQGDARP
ncbi:MAG TPA: vanadium-dependent haloperoxidase [Burkholderiaceae bacterium]|nr:vanadium-dependent haloperoxidase [Burkholderiaceae bacterium]